MKSRGLLRLVGVVGCLIALGAEECNRGDTSAQGFLRADVLGDMQFAGVPRARFDTTLAAACGSSELTALGRSALQRLPYLQKVGSDSIEVLYTALTDQPATLEIVDADGATVTRVEAALDGGVELDEGYQFVARAEGLPSDQVLCYRLGGAEGELLGSTGFRTAPTAESDSPIRLIAMGDLGRSAPDQFAVRDQIKRVEHDLGLILGDLAYDVGAPDEIDANFFGVYEELLGHVPWFVASGNHEYKTDEAQPFRDAFALPENGGPAGKERWYSFDWGRLHVTVLDTELLIEEQIEWLDRDLAENDLPFTIVIGHKPPYSAGTRGPDVGVREAFTPVLSKHQVQLVLLGHEHHYERTKPIDGVTYVIAGGGGRGTRAVGASDLTAMAARVASFVYVEIVGDTMRLVAIDATGQEFDSWATTL